MTLQPGQFFYHFTTHCLIWHREMQHLKPGWEAARTIVGLIATIEHQRTGMKHGISPN